MTEELAEDQTCDGIDAPEACSEPELDPLEKALEMNGLVRCDSCSKPDSLHFYATKVSLGSCFPIQAVLEQS